ncbi:hypothetical protein VTK26DRAFT_3330 [Humicola hyalothermophila]
MTAQTRSVLPDRTARKKLDGLLADLQDAIQAHPRLRAPLLHQSFTYVWSFVTRIKYILADLGNVEAGRPLRHLLRIPGSDRARCQRDTPNPEKAKELMTDVTKRFMAVQAMVSHPNTMIMTLMRRAAVDFGDDVRAKVTRVLQQFEALNLLPPSQEKRREENSDKEAEGAGPVSSDLD